MYSGYDCPDCEDQLSGVARAVQEMHDDKNKLREMYYAAVKGAEATKKELESLKEEYFHLRIHYKHLLKERGE